MQVGELFATFSLDTDGFAKAVMGIEDDLSRISATAMSAGAMLERTLTDPLAGLGKSALNAGLSFSSQMSAVEAISGATGDSLNALRQAAIDAGSQTSFTATQAGEALQYMAMAGWQTEDMLAGLRPIMDLAAASGADLASTSDIVTDAMTALGYRADETWKVIRDGEAVDTGISNVQHFADVLAATATNSNTNVEMLGQSFKYAAPLAGALGYSVEDVAMTLGLMANQGIKASQAGTTLRSLFKRLADPPKAAKAAMAEYGITLTDTEGNMKSLSEVMGDLRKASESMTETQKAAFASAIAGTTGMSGFLALLNSSEEDVQSLQAAIESCGNATEDMANVRLDNAAGAITIFKSAVEGLEITLFSYIEGALIKAVKGLTDLVDSFRNAEPYVQKATAAFLAITAAIGPAVKAFGILLPFLAGMVTPLGALTAGLGVFGLTFLDFATAAGPAMDESGRYIKRGAGKIETAIRELSARGAEQLSRFAVEAQSYIVTISNAMPGMLSAISEAASTLLPVLTETVLTVISTLGAGISRNMDGILDMGVSVLLGLARGMAQAMPKVLADMAQMVSSILTAFTDPERISSALTQLQQAFSKAFEETDWSGIGAGLAEAAKKVLANLGQLSEGVRDFLANLDLSAFGEALTKALSTLGKSLSELLFGEAFSETDMRELGARISEWLRDGFKALGTELLFGDLKETDWQSLGKTIGSKIRSGFEGFTDFLSGLILGPALSGNTWQDAGKTLWERIRSGFAVSADFLSGLILGSTDSENWSELGQKIMDRIREGMEAAGNGLSSILEKFQELDWQALGAEIREKIQTSLTGLGDFLLERFKPEGGVNWEDLGRQIGTALRNGITSIGNFLTGLFFGDSEPDLAGLGKAWAEKIRSGFDMRKGIIEGFLFGEETDWRERGRMVSELIQSGFSFASQVLVTALGLDGSVDWANLGSDVWEKIQSGFDAATAFLEGLFLSDGLDSFQDLGRQIWENVESGLNGAKTALVNILTDGDESVSVFQGLGAKIGEAITTGMEGLRGLLTRLLDLGDEGEASWKDIGAKLFQTLLDGMTAAARMAGDFITGLIMGNDGEATIVDAGKRIWELLLGAVTDALTSAGSLAGMLAENILRFDWVPAGMEIGANLVKGITGAFTALKDGMEGFMRELFIGVKAAVLSWFGIEMDDMSREMESRVFMIDGKKFTGKMLANLVSSSQATVTEQARAWVTLVQAGFEEQAGSFDASPSVLVLAEKLESGLLAGQDRIRAAAALIFSGFGDSVINQDFDLYVEAVQLMQDLYRGIDDGTDVTLEMCRELGLSVPATIAETLGMGDWSASGTAATEGMTAALVALGEEADALAAGLGRETGQSYTEGVNAALGEATLDGTKVAEAMTAAAGEAAAAGGENLGRQVMESAAQAVASGREQLSNEAAMATDPARFSEAEANAKSAGGQIGGAIAPEITARIGDVEAAMQALTDAIGTGFTPVADRLRQGMKTAMDAVLEELDRGAAEIAAKIQTLSETMAVVQPTVAVTSGGTETETAPTLDTAGIVRDMVKGFEQIIGQLVVILRKEMTGVDSALTEGGTTLSENLSGLITALTGLAQSGGETLISQTSTQMEQLAELFHQGLEKIKTDMTEAVQALHNLYVPLAEILRQDTDRMMQNMRQAFDSGAEQIRSAMQNLVNMLCSTFSPLQQTLPGLMQQAMQSLQAALESGGSAAASLASSISSRIASAARSSLGSGIGSEIGRNFMSGMKSGIQSMASSVALAASAAASSAVSAMKQTLKINSPSKVTMEIGQYMDEGVALGLSGGEMVRSAGESVQKAVRMMADTATIPDMTGNAVPIRMESRTMEAQDGLQLDRVSAAEIAEILADRLIQSGALGGDLYLDGTRVGERVAEPVSRTISARTRLTVRGRSAAGVLT